jgi:predicted dienelactone hydrolase
MGQGENMKAVTRKFLLGALSAAFMTCVGCATTVDRPYDPLALAASRKVETLDCTVTDTKRGRDIPLRIYLPAGKAAAPVVLFSHGLGGSRKNNPYLGEHWAARGYVVVFLQHAGSDEAEWIGLPPAERMNALKKAANLKNTLLRLRDVPAVLDQLERWNQSSDSPLAGRMDLKRIGMSGHSFGAVTTQGVSGQRTALGGAFFTDPRIKAALAMSPGGPRKGSDPQQVFGGVTIPWLLMTGTKDVSPVGDMDVASRLAVFPALPPGGKYELVLDGAEHSAFGDRALPGDKEQRNPNHHRAILALSTAFWDAWLREDAAARAWLDGQGPRSVLEKQDRWQRK